MRNLDLSDADGRFEVSVLDATAPQRVVLFAVGGGGDPQRHRPLLEALAADGSSVVAAHSPRLQSPRPTADALVQRARRLALALEALPGRELPVVGVGHSIGAAMLLALAGGQLWLDAAGPLSLPRITRLSRVALLAPATDFFRAPAALDAVRAPILAWAGGRDSITPAAQSLYVQEALGRDLVEVRVTDDAGHFSFMHTPPPAPYWSETLPDRDAFLSEMCGHICRFVAA
jgi:pimeloyl-ACP methyl ester carboxylesterase